MSSLPLILRFAITTLHPRTCKTNPLSLSVLRSLTVVHTARKEQFQSPKWWWSMIATLDRRPVWNHLLKISLSWKATLCNDPKIHMIPCQPCSKPSWVCRRTWDEQKIRFVAQNWYHLHPGSNPPFLVGYHRFGCGCRIREEFSSKKLLWLSGLLRYPATRNCCQSQKFKDECVLQYPKARFVTLSPSQCSISLSSRTLMQRVSSRGPHEKIWE